ncbi:hypothetical protein Pelo_16619 [Pelomyxa schiedti]|nr:hypothetical protein Pelo_16619 [Pelomyxa schiedti]
MISELRFCISSIHSHSSPVFRMHAASVPEMSASVPVVSSRVRLAQAIPQYHFAVQPRFHHAGFFSLATMMPQRCFGCESATSGAPRTASSFPKSSPRSQKNCTQWKKRGGEDMERSSKKIPWTLLADICEHCAFAMVLATSNTKYDDMMCPWHFWCGQQGFFFVVIVSSIQPAWWLYSTIALASLSQVLLSCFEINDPTSAVLLGFCWSSFCFCPSVAIALGVANDPVAASQVPLAVELCVWLFSGLRACALHMIGNDALFTFHYSCFWLSQHYCWIALSALTADLKVLGNCQMQKIEWLWYCCGGLLFMLMRLCQLMVFVLFPELLYFCQCMLMWIMAGAAFVHGEIQSNGMPCTSQSAQIPHQISFRNSTYCLIDSSTISKSCINLRILPAGLSPISLSPRFWCSPCC